MQITKLCTYVLLLISETLRESHFPVSNFSMVIKAIDPIESFKPQGTKLSLWGRQIMWLTRCSVRTLSKDSVWHGRTDMLIKPCWA